MRIGMSGIVRRAASSDGSVSASSVVPSRAAAWATVPAAFAAEARSSQTLARLAGLALRFEEGEASAPPRCSNDDGARDALGGVARWCLARIDSLASDALADRAGSHRASRGAPDGRVAR